MIVVDANYFLRALVRPVTPEDQVMSETARTLFRLIQADEETFITSDAVIAEVVFILSSKHLYNIPRADVAARLRPLLQLAGCRLPRKRFCLQALDLWESTAKLSFVDALTAVYAKELRSPLASFDVALNQIPDLTLWPSPANHE